jgi:hypothetical protein
LIALPQHLIRRAGSAGTRTTCADPAGIGIIAGTFNQLSVLEA